MKKKNLVTAVLLAAVVFAAMGIFTACEMEVAEEAVKKPIITPYISVPPSSKAYFTTDTVAALTAQVWDWDAKDGELSYQWFEFTSMATYAANGAGTPVSGADGSGTIDPETADTVTIGTTDIAINVNTITLPLSVTKTANSKYYYYLEITNTDPTTTDAVKEKTVRSEIATISFSAPGSALFPIIARHPVSALYRFGRSLVIAELSVKATSPDNGELSYEWFYDPTNTGATTGLTAITNTSKDPQIYRPTIDLLVPGRNFFFVKITNTSLNGTAEELSAPAVIDMEPGQTALEPVITLQPQDRLYFNAGEVGNLTVAAEPLIDGGTLSYQWYSNTRPEARRGTVIGGATAAAYKPTVTANGTYYYYAVVTNTNPSVVSSTKIATASSRAVKVVIANPNDVPSYNATVTVSDPRVKGNRFQYVRGYGGMDTAWANFPEQKPADMETMFNPDWGLGYNINRIMINPGNTNVNISIRDLINSHRPHYYENVKIVNKYGGYNLASPWSPPKEWKSNNSINGGGHLVYTYRQMYADYLRAFARHMYDAGAPIYAISISNEPNYTAGYDGCEWTPVEMREFYKAVNPKPYTTGIRGYGGGKELVRVLTMNGESANTPFINKEALLDTDSRAGIDLLGRHVYGETQKTLWRLFPLTGAEMPDSADWSSAQANILDRDDGTKMEVWMTEHNINSANPTAYPNDSTWNYVWRFMNDIDLVMRLNNENAFVWWAAKRFYSMIGDGQFGTRDGVVLPRGIGLSHYAKYSIDTHRVGISVSGRFGGTGGANITSNSVERPTSPINNTTFNLDSTAIKINAYASIPSGKDNKPIVDYDLTGTNPIPINDPVDGIEYISLIMWAPTNTSGGGGGNMGTMRLVMPAGFLIGGVSAHKSTSATNMFQPETVQVNQDRTAAFVTMGPGQIVSVKLTRQ